MLRRIELVSGLAAGLVGAAGLAYAVFGPTGRYQESSIGTDGTVTRAVTGSTNLLQEGIEPATAAFLVLAFVLFLGVAAGASLRADGHCQAGLLLLWSSVALLVVVTWVALASVGLLLVPGTLLALIAATTGSIVRSGRLPQERSEYGQVYGRRR